MKKIIVIALTLCCIHCIYGQSSKIFYNDKKTSIMFGLSQPILLHGFNIAATYTTGRLYFEYSHGISLDLESTGMTKEEKKYFSNIHVPFSTGFGAGYRLLPDLNVFWEFKLHEFEPEEKETGKSFSYKTFEMGPAVSYRFFADKKRRFFAEPVIRYWFTTAVFGNEDFDNGKIMINNGADSYAHQPHQFGLFANISIGMVLK